MGTHNSTWGAHGGSGCNKDPQQQHLFSQEKDLLASHHGKYKLQSSGTMWSQQSLSWLPVSQDMVVVLVSSSVPGTATPPPCLPHCGFPS